MNMRTTLNLDGDVLEEARKLAGKKGLPFKRIVNEALRMGLEGMRDPRPSKPYKTEPRRMGLKAGRNLDNIQELLAQVEGEDFK